MNAKLKSAFELIINSGCLFKHTDPAQAIDNLDQTPDVDALTLAIFANPRTPVTVIERKVYKMLNAIEAATGYKPSIMVGRKAGFETVLRRKVESEYDVMVNEFTQRELSDMSVVESTKARDLRSLQLANIAVFVTVGNGPIKNPAYHHAIEKGALVSVIRI